MSWKEWQEKYARPKTLFDPPKPKEAGTVRDEKVRLSAQARAILDRLRRGPATNAELAEIALKYTGRISEVRTALRVGGEDVVVVERDRKTGLTTYEVRPFRK